jgi:hypothetical protein
MSPTVRQRAYSRQLTPPTNQLTVSYGRSTFTGASPHVGSALVLSVDLRNFYGQISFQRVSAVVQKYFEPAVSDWIEGACFVDGRLPFGFRTSPVLSNLAFAGTDLQIAAFARERNVTYTRWVDDLSFSGELVNDEFLEELVELLDADHWQLNERKTRFMRRSPYVLGLYVGHDVDRPRLPRWMRQKLMLETYYFSRYGKSHFERNDVFRRQRLFGLYAYANAVDPKLAARLAPRLAEGLRREG